MQVCTITGRCFAAMLTEREEHAGEWERGRSRGGQGGEEGEEAGDDAGEEGFSGRLGRAFAAGGCRGTYGGVQAWWAYP